MRTTAIVDRVACRMAHANAPLSHPYSWGPIHVIDRFEARNSFVSFGGELFGERAGSDALLLIFRSPAPIFRLPGHSQRRDRLSDEALTFFSRMIPRIWAVPDYERLVGAVPPDALFCAFLLHESRRVNGSPHLREAFPGDATALAHELDRIVRNRPEALTAGRELLELLELRPVGAH